MAFNPVHMDLDVMTETLIPTSMCALLIPYNLILDCTNNTVTQYLLSDTAVLLGKPLISGAAQRFDGQLCTYNLGLEGPCYQCLFPKSPSQEATPSCTETSVTRRRLVLLDLSKGFL